MDLRLLDIDVKIHDEVIKTFLSFIQKTACDKEAGGVLTGKIFDNHIEVISCSEPSKLDKRKRYNFIRSHKAAQRFINKVFYKSKGEEVYLGEWHTHPEYIPTPSRTDLKSFRKTINENNLNSEIHFMIIVGITKIYVGTYKMGELINEERFDNPKEQIRLL